MRCSSASCVLKTSRQQASHGVSCLRFRYGMGVAKKQPSICRSVCEPQGINTRRVNTARWSRSKQLLCRRRQCTRVSTSVGAGLPMRFHVAQQHKLSNAHSPFRVIQQSGREVQWINWVPRPAASPRRGGFHTAELCSTTYCISSVGGWRRIRRPRSPKRRSRSQLSSTTFAGRSTSIPRPRRQASTVESERPSVPCGWSFLTLLLCWRPAFSTGVLAAITARLWAPTPRTHSVAGEDAQTLDCAFVD